MYRKLAERLIEFSPLPMRGRRVLDLGSGTGVGSQAAMASGATVVAADLALGMLQFERAGRPPALVGSAERLPIRDGAFDVVLAPFILNHLGDPAVGVREAGRVGACLVASTYAVDDDHPVKAAVDGALTEAGWEPPPWFRAFKADMAAWGTVADATDAIVRGGMRPLLVEHLEVAFPELGPHDMVAWRMGLAQCAPFLDALDPAARVQVTARARELLGPAPEPLARRVIFLASASETFAAEVPYSGT